MMWGFYAPGCGREGRGRRGPWDFDAGTWGGFWGGPGRGGGWGRGRGGRVFEQGDLKYVILKLLDEKPRHGYEIIKELEERFGGAYSPSPGTVYPTLSMLEDLGYARATPEEGGKKIYEITPEGREYLAQHRGTVDDIFERIAEFGAAMFSDDAVAVQRAFGDLARATFRQAVGGGRDRERLKRIREVLERAAREIDSAGD
ncbi:MAG TPA: PadR family transcriptional regulator [Longimicrobiaceae bacterium]|nr:PadR family transcriptional regulator [Longimicrobiaceae bacterium]